jgi:hypothetical protein
MTTETANRRAWAVARWVRRKDQAEIERLRAEVQALRLQVEEAKRYQAAQEAYALIEAEDQ